ncbi:MAG TPA: saccharopine dehydrogenase C-terminal domain-containing protein [Ignavibacteriaceae bacterium]|jgi:saccharopine dehydrogenase-like NADP-dependent oxidoreductase|nr:MAG: Lysine 6-dehydrogenase [Ignavibacteria bacterium ADurb.Bin266]OQY74967.1 MAG: saccharopine dehydrogenase [Ignavibacteriales bacterium UTCHB2]HQF42756.1 saccharopine dehydrogenase C-terminal domain-containing protein [Ignavibacteriaceae bacterium]HQI39491.1 saccharopine dehydrogenase C-terminal domain-containing protein [Ignavibacteriaceae bacterium]HQJ45384.1 saccharopine dehydrogenase C-terminal domain-containing protein [Ignavibacteriaceae bacterium]
MNIIVLGSGLIGRPMAIDLSKEKLFNVTIADLNQKNLDKIPKQLPIKKIQKDLSDPQILKSLISKNDIVLNALPSFIGFKTLKEIIKAKKNAVDITFAPEDPFELDKLAKQNNVTAIVDCGVAPGMSNLLAGYVNSLLDFTETILIYVGGLPVIREYPYEYKAGFSPTDVIEEYTRPARFVENGKLVVRPALSDSELINFDEVGTLEAFNSDGLRTLAKTLTAPNMKEKTLRYPGHIEKIKVLRESGFFNQREIDIKGMKIKPIDFTSKILFPLWELKDGDEDFTVMRIIIEGIKNRKKVRYSYNLLDRHDKKNNIHSMARTTGYTATSVVRLLSKGLFDRKGICPPEYIGENSQCVNFVIKELKNRGVIYQESIEAIK